MVITIGKEQFLDKEELNILHILHKHGYYGLEKREQRLAENANLSDYTTALGWLSTHYPHETSKTDNQVFARMVFNTYKKKYYTTPFKQSLTNSTGGGNVYLYPREWAEANMPQIIQRWEDKGYPRGYNMPKMVVAE